MLRKPDTLPERVVENHSLGTVSFGQRTQSQERTPRGQGHPASILSSGLCLSVRRTLILASGFQPLGFLARLSARPSQCLRNISYLYWTSRIKSAKSLKGWPQSFQRSRPEHVKQERTRLRMSALRSGAEIKASARAVGAVRSWSMTT